MEFEETYEFDDEEMLDLVAVDAEMIKTVIRTQGQIISHMNNIYLALRDLTSSCKKMNENIGKMADTNQLLTDATRDLIEILEEEK